MTKGIRLETVLQFMEAYPNVPAGVMIQAIENIAKVARAAASAKVDPNDYMKQCMGSRWTFGTVVHNGFTWDYTPQGHNYWNAIKEKYE